MGVLMPLSNMGVFKSVECCLAIPLWLQWCGGWLDRLATLKLLIIFSFSKSNQWLRVLSTTNLWLIVSQSAHKMRDSGCSSLTVSHCGMKKLADVLSGLETRVSQLWLHPTGQLNYTTLVLGWGLGGIPRLILWRVTENFFLPQEPGGCFFFP